MLIIGKKNYSLIVRNKFWYSVEIIILQIYFIRKFRGEKESLLYSEKNSSDSDFRDNENAGDSDR